MCTKIGRTWTTYVVITAQFLLQMALQLSGRGLPEGIWGSCFREYTLQNRAHYIETRLKNGVFMMLCGRNDLGMKLHRLTTIFGLVKSEWTKSQAGVVKFRFASG